jgi:hypothetical protein
MAEHDPMLKQMLDENPDMINMMTSSSAMEMLNDPQVVGMALGMSNRMNRGPTVSTLQGTAFPSPGGASQQPGGNSTGQSEPRPAQPNPSPLGGAFNMSEMMRLLNRMSISMLNECSSDGRHRNRPYLCWANWNAHD